MGTNASAKVILLKMRSVLVCLIGRSDFIKFSRDVWRLFGHVDIKQVSFSYKPEYRAIYCAKRNELNRRYEKVPVFGAIEP
jgi:hypothetical protein